MSDNEKKTYYNIFSSCWKLFSKYASSEAPKDHEYWSQVIDEASRIRESYPGRLTKELINATLKELEEINNV